MYKNIILFLGMSLFILNGCGGGESNALSKQSTINNQNATTQTKKTSNTIDLLIVVDKNDRNNFNGINETKLEHAIAVSNKIYKNSQLDIKLNIKKIQPYSLKNETSEDVLYAMYKDKNITSIRNEVKADLVIVYRKYADDGTCGIAYINDTFDRDFGYGHVSLDCISSTLSHEIGHSMGLDHSEEDTSSYAHGYGVEGVFHTVMAYGTTYKSHNQMFNYSSPELECEGQKCGIDVELENGTDAVKALKNAVNFVASFN